MRFRGYSRKSEVYSSTASTDAYSAIDGGVGASRLTS